MLFQLKQMSLSQFCLWLYGKNGDWFIHLFGLNSTASFCLFFFFLDIKVSVIDGSSPFASAYDLENIIGSYRERNCKLSKASFVSTNFMSKENLIYLKSRWMYLMSQFIVYM